jgi:hypothetical protein
MIWDMLRYVPEKVKKMIELDNFTRIFTAYGARA